MLFQLEEVGFSYDKRTVLKEIDLEIAAGHLYGVLGPNGCGKSTTVDLLMGLRKPSSGRVAYRGKSMASYSRKQLSREMALVPQNFYIDFPFTGHEVVMMGRYPQMPRFSAPSQEDFEIVEAVMAATGTTPFSERRVTEMSGGERQRIVFARALAQDTPLLLLDEATSNLDVNHTLRLLDLVSHAIREKGRTVIAVIQDINLAATYCDRLILMKNGGVHAVGETRDVLTEANIRAVFGVDSRVSYDDYSESMKVSFRKGYVESD